MLEGRVLTRVALGVITCWVVGCRDLPAPEGGVQSVSPIRLPSPGLVAGDTMRDSTGSVAPLRVTAYALDGDSLSPQPDPTFVVLDTGAHLAGALLVGDSIGKTVRVVGTIGSLQTQFASVKVTAMPDTLVPADSLVFRKSYSLLGGDTEATSAELGVIVRHLLPTPAGVEAVIVRYSIDRAPASSGQDSAVVLMNGSARSSRDTTDASGRAARTARLRILNLTPASTGTDTVEISATASYGGRVLGLVQFLVIFTQTSP
jgi:hypothetical protein